MLDTDLCIRVLRDRPVELRDRFNAEAQALCISSVTLAELFYGAEKSANPIGHRQKVEAFAGRVDLLHFDQAAAAHFGEIRAVLEREGQVIGPYDLMIAAHARSRGLIVVTGYLGEFRRVAGLRAEDWLASG